MGRCETNGCTEIIMIVLISVHIDVIIELDSNVHRTNAELRIHCHEASQSFGLLCSQLFHVTAGGERGGDQRDLLRDDENK